MHAARAFEPRVLGVQEHRQVERGGVFERASQHLCVQHRRKRVGEADAAGLVERLHVGQEFPFKPARQRAERVDEGETETPGARLQHLRHRRGVDHRVRVRRAAERGDAGGDRGAGFGFDGGLVFEAGFAQPRAQVHQPGADDFAVGVDGARGLEARGGTADTGDEAPGVYIKIFFAVNAVGRIDEASAGNHQAHTRLPVSGVPPRISAITAMRTAMP